MGSLQRVEQETVSSQNLANAIDNMNRTRIDATGNRLRLMDGERLSWSGSTTLAGFARDIAPRVGYVDPKHQTGKLIQQLTKGTPRAPEAWTDGPGAVDDKYVELDCELAVALASATEGSLKWSQVTGSWHKRWLMVIERPAMAQKPILATPKPVSC